MLARPMARSAVLLLALTAVAGLGVAWAVGSFDGPLAPLPSPADGPSPASAAPTADAERTPAPAAAAARTATPAASAAGKPALPNDPLADRPTACLQAIDRSSKRPVGEAPVYRCKDLTAIAFTDAQGLAPVPLPGPEQLAVVAPGYLARMTPTRLGSSEAEPQTVEMVRDEWSLPRALRLVDAAGAAIAEARVRCRPTVARRHIPNPAPPADAAAQRAWVETSNVARLGLPNAFVVAAGALPPSTVHTVADGQTLRFEAAGEYELLAATADGRIARARAKLAAEGDAAPPIVLTFAAGAQLRGLVVDPSGAPLAGAEVQARVDLPVGTTAITGPDGAFVLAPLFAGEPVALHVRHGLHQSADVTALTPPRDDLVLMLTPLRQAPLRGRVRARPGLQPLPGASVVWQPSGLAPIAATTGADGEFLLQATGANASRLAISCNGYLAYAELVAPGATFADYDLLPAGVDDRVAAGLTALLEGVVVDAAGTPAPDVDVAWSPTAPPTPPALPTGRRVLVGGALALPRTVRTGPDGSFRFETTAFGPGRVHAVDAHEGGVDAVATAGAARNGLRIRR